MTSRPRLLFVVMMMWWAAAAYGARDAAMKRGFDADAVFDTKSVDNVNAFNGNLVATIPLGPEFTTSGSLKYRFSLVYNSNIWDYFGHSGVVSSPEGANKNWIDQYQVFERFNKEDYDGNTTDPNADGVEAIPARSFNAGVGWTVTLGQLMTTAMDNSVQHVVYIGADGAEHAFFSALHGASAELQTVNADFYTRDGSYLRMRVGGDKNDREIHLPDGVIQRFRCAADCGKQNAQWVLYEMGDPYGNLLVVSRSPSDARPAQGTSWVWTYKEYFSKTTGYKHKDDIALIEVRQSVLTFKVTLADPAYPWVSEVRLEEVQVPAYAGDEGSGTTLTSAKYKLNYRQDEIYRDRQSSWWAVSGTDPLVYPIASGVADQIRVSLLTSVDLPPNSGEETTTNPSGRWELQYYGDDCPDPASASCDAAGFWGERLWNPNSGVKYRVNSVYGRLKHLRLPTQSGIRYQYDARAYPSVNLCERGGGPDPGRFTRLFGVSRRQLTDRNGQPYGLPTLYFGRAYTLVLHECKPYEFVSTIVQPPNVTPGKYDSDKTNTRSMVTVTFHSIFAEALDPACDASSPCWTVREHGLPVSHKRQKAAGGVIRGLSTSVYDCKTSLFQEDPGLDDTVRRIVDHNLIRNPDGSTNELTTCGAPKRTTWVRYEDSDSPECNADDLGRCTSSNRREQSTRTEFLDDKFSTGCSPYYTTGCDPVYTVTDRSDFDGLGNYRRVVSDGNLLKKSISSSNRSDQRISYTWFNPLVTYTRGTAFTGYPATWILGLSKESFVTQDSESNVRRTNYDSATGFLLGARTLKTKTVVDAPDVAARDKADLLTTRRREVRADNRVAVTDYFFGGDTQELPVSADFTEPPAGWIYAIERIGRGGATGVSVNERLAYKEKCGASADTVLETTTVDAASATVRSVTDEFGATTLYKYDLLGRIVRLLPPQTTTPKEVALNYDYPSLTAGEHLVTMSRTGGESMEWEYDEFGRMTTVRKDMEAGNAFGVRNKSVTEYTMTGLKATVSSVIANGTNVTDLLNTDYTYDIFGRATKIVPPGSDADSRKTTFEYQGIRETVRTQEGVSVGGYGSRGKIATAESRDAHGRLVAVDEDKGTSDLRTRYEYDLGDRLIRVTSPAGGNSDRTFVYDGRGLLTDEVHPELGGNTIKWRAYDARGNARQRALVIPGKSTSPFDVGYVFNQSEQLVSVSQLSPSRPLKSFRYDRGKLKQATRQNYVVNAEATSQALEVPVVTTFDYDTAGRVTGKNLSAGFEAGSTYQYDQFGRVTQTEYKSTPGGTRRLTAGWSNGYLTSLTQSLPGARTYVSAAHYHPNGLTSELRRGNGQTDWATLGDDALPRPARLYVQGSSSLTPGWDSDGYSYDGAGSIESIGVDKFRYDRRGRLTGMRTSGGSVGGAPDLEQTYGYDLSGNMVSIGGVSAASIPTDVVTNRLQSSWATYDDAGNVIRLADTRRTGFELAMHETLADGSKKSWFDAENMLTRIEGRQTDAGGTKLQFGRVFLYDANDERVAVQDYNYPGADGSPTVRELWTLRGINNEVLRELERIRGSAPSWKWVKDNVYAGTKLVAAVLPGEAVRHYHTDHLGTVRYVTDANGAPLDTRKYWAFGEEINARPDENRKKFTGHERDDDGTVFAVGDLDYMHARFYAGVLGRFLSTDPVNGSPSAPDSWNRYTYVRNRPVNAADPTGRVDEDKERLMRQQKAEQEARERKRQELAKAGEANLDPSNPRRGVSAEAASKAAMNQFTPEQQQQMREDAIEANPASDPIMFVAHMGAGMLLREAGSFSEAAFRGATGRTLGRRGAGKIFEVARGANGVRNVQMISAAGRGVGRASFMSQSDFAAMVSIQFQRDLAAEAGKTVATMATENLLHGDEEEHDHE